jgi:hypothetical protein
MVAVDIREPRLRRVDSVVMPIDNTASTVTLFLPEPSALFGEPAAPWPSRQNFEEHLLELCRIPVGADRSPSEAAEAEQLYELASPIKHWLDMATPYPVRNPLSHRLDAITALMREGRLDVEHALRLMTPGKPSWLNNLNTVHQVSTAHVLFQDIAKDFRGERASDIGRALFRGLLEIEGDSPSRVLLNMGLFVTSPCLPPVDREKAALAFRVADLMDWMQFTPAEIKRALDVQRKKFPLPSEFFTRPA